VFVPVRITRPPLFTGVETVPVPVMLPATVSVAGTPSRVSVPLEISIPRLAWRVVAVRARSQPEEATRMLSASGEAGTAPKALSALNRISPPTSCVPPVWVFSPPSFTLPKPAVPVSVVAEPNTLTFTGVAPLSAITESMLTGVVSRVPTVLRRSNTISSATPPLT